MYPLGTAGGLRFQAQLWRLRGDGKLTLLDIAPDEADRMEALMAQYANVPMDMADASLVAVAESRNLRQLFSIDSDFYIYRLADGSLLDLVR
jgi:predicted nucleic acid-binding protein